MLACIAAAESYLTYSYTIRINVIVFVCPVSNLWEQITHINRRVPPMHNHSGIGILNYPDVCMTALLVYHMLRAPVRSARFDTLVAHPLVVLGNLARPAVNTSPECDARRHAVKLYYHIRVPTGPPEVVP